MKSGLSIAAAADEHPQRPALIVEDKTYSYGELARCSRDLPYSEHNVHRATSSLETALRLYASLERRVPLSLLSASASADERRALAGRVPADLGSEIALVLFTSGSSGEPKGVKLSRSALLASARASAQALGWQSEDRWLCCLPLSHIGGLSILLRCLVDRKTAVLSDGFDEKAVQDAIHAQQVSHISLVPTMLWRLLEAGVRAPQHLRVTLIGGAALEESLAERARRAGFRLHLSYGMTETASQVVCGGRPLAGVALRLSSGRLAIKAPMVMDGYLPPHDRQSSLRDGWFHTEDAAVLDEHGGVRILGRVDDTIISGGENINPREIEAALNRAPRIRASHALGLPHEEWGQMLVALVLVDDESLDPMSLCPRELRGHRKPKALIPVRTLPLLASGKVDQERARAIATEWKIADTT